MRRLFVFVVTLLIAYSSSVFVSPTVAADHCADISVTSQRLLANTEPTSGPHAVAVPAGEYRLVMTSADEAHAVDPPLQAREVWFFVTDGGYTSPTTPDLADHLLVASFDFGIVTFDAMTTITFFHGAWGPGSQSVTGTVTFQCVSPEPTTTVAPTTSTPVTVPATTVPATTVPATTAPPTTVAPTSTVPTTTPASVAPTTIAPTTTAANPPGAVLPAPSLVRPTTTQKGEVLPITITPGPGDDDLARTGGELSILWLAAFLLGTGAVLLVVAQRLRPTS